MSTETPRSNSEIFTLDPREEYTLEVSESGTITTKDGTVLEIVSLSRAAELTNEYYLVAPSSATDHGGKAVVKQGSEVAHYINQEFTKSERTEDAYTVFKVKR